MNDKDLKLDLTRKKAFDNLNQLISDYKLLSSQKEVENVEKIKGLSKWAKIEDDGKGKGRLNVTSSIKMVSEESEKRAKQDLMDAQQEVINLQKLI